MDSTARSANAAPVLPATLPTLAEVIEKIGVGPAQLRTSLLAGGVWAADGAELLLIGTVTRAISEEWQLHAWQRGFVVSVVFFGVLLGNLVCGPLADRFGRRMLILLSYAGIAVFSVLSTCVPNFIMLCCTRLFVGAAFGIGQPPVSALCSEVTPTHWRIAMMACTQTMFVFGEMYSALLVWMEDPYMHVLNWRRLLLLGAIPCILMGVLACLFLNQSPSYLAVRGDYAGAKAVLESMRADNRAWDVAVDFQFHQVDVHQRSAADLLGILFSPAMLYSTIVLIYSCFTLNVLYYGSLYAFPQVITDVAIGTSPAMSLFLGAVCELPGLLIAAIACIWWRRKPVISAYLVCSSLSLIAFGQGIGSTGSGWILEALTQVGYMGIKGFANLGFVVLYQYAAEVYPTVARATGTSACIAGGRLGAIVAPLVFEWNYDMVGHAGVFFSLTACLCLVNLMLVVFLPFETYGKPLEDTVGELGSLKRSLEKSMHSSGGSAGP